MTFTEEETKILKLMCAEVKARQKLNIVNKTMGDLIRAQFSTIDTSIREEYRPIFEPLQVDVKTAQENLVKEFE